MSDQFEIVKCVVYMDVIGDDLLLLLLDVFNWIVESFLFVEKKGQELKIFVDMLKFKDVVVIMYISGSMGMLKVKFI